MIGTPSPAKTAIIRAILLGVGLVLLGMPSGPARAASFRLFDAMLFANSPDMSKLGFQRLPIVDAHQLWPVGASGDAPPQEQEINRIVASGAAAYGLLVIDIEHWDMLDGKQREQSRNKYFETLKLFRHAAPGLKIGFYSVLPSRDYWTPNGLQGDAGYRSWQLENDFAAPLAAGVDALFPSLYTFYPDQKGWRTYAIANLREARRIAGGKPVYCFLWPQYHDSYELISGDYWRLQLDTCHQLADGIVILGGYTQDPNFKPLPWSDDAPWWKATLQFIKSIH